MSNYVHLTVLFALPTVVATFMAWVFPKQRGVQLLVGLFALVPALWAVLWMLDGFGQLFGGWSGIQLLWSAPVWIPVWAVSFVVVNYILSKWEIR